MSQPLLGVIATALAVVAALGFVSLFDLGSFIGQVSFFMLCLIPMQVVIAVLWGARAPFAPGLRQPARGAALLAVNLVAGAIVAPVALRIVGEGVSPPGPIPSHFVIIAVPATFWLAIMFGGWPFTSLIRNQVAAGMSVLAASYAITFVVFRLFFDYAFLQDAPVYLASSPHGLYDGVAALVFIVTALAVMFVVLCFDLWPFTRVPGVMTQPVLGVVWTLVALAGGGLAMGIGVGVMGMDPMVFLTRVTVPFIFGTILVLNMLQNTLFAAWAQPMKGVLNAVSAMVIGVALAWLYGSLAPAITGPVASGAPGYEYEIWLANALLSVTFPFLIFYAAFFGYWPLAQAPAPEAREVARTQS
jgi:hypothetical protein